MKKLIHGIPDLGSSMASSKPWTGNGVKQSKPL